MDCASPSAATSRSIDCWRNCGGWLERRRLMKRLPRSLGLVICERVEVDRENGLYSLINVFFRLPWSNPGPLLKRFVVYGTLFNGSGEGVMRLVVTHMET